MSRIIQPRPKKDWCGCGTGEIYGDGLCKKCLIRHATKSLETLRPMRWAWANATMAFVDTGLPGDIRNL